MGKRKPQAAYKPKKRRFTGNMYTWMQTSAVSDRNDAEQTSEDSDKENTRSPDAATSHNQPSASSSKLFKNEEGEEEFDPNDDLTGFRFIDCELLVQFIQFLLCPSCKKPLGASRLTTAEEDRTDLASAFTFFLWLSAQSFIFFF
ncbi:hypothetical protein BaRGS_00011298 [Batillaria attramentaria]|uniref:Uncharacterized protein n=1 Tax=Batillaria attramentaria TaxID=370345 RepID=A0ABD0LDA8_9CAEN